MRFVVDSNVWVSALDTKDLFHAECRPVLSKIIHAEIEAICPVIVFAETVCAVRRRTGREDLAAEALRDLSLLAAVTWLDVSLDMAKRACVLGIETGLKGVDSLVVLLAKELGLQLVTKDREMIAKAPAGMTVLEPLQLISQLVQ